MVKMIVLHALLLVAGYKQIKSGAGDRLESASLQTRSAMLQVKGSGSQLGVVLQLKDGTVSYGQPTPLLVQVVAHNGQAYWAQAPYHSIDSSGGRLVATATMETRNGSTLDVKDSYTVNQQCDCFVASREVIVVSVGAGDAGFSTRFALQRPHGSSLSEYDAMVPGVWYRQNEHASEHALASSLGDNYYWFREDRLPLPLVMLRHRGSGATLTVYHHQADGATFATEDGLDRIIDGRMQFAAMGLENREHPLVGLTFPGSEGERTGIYGMAATKRWAWRSHPLQQGFKQQYQVAFSLNNQPDYPTALKNTWATYYELSHPMTYTVDLNEVYRQQIGVLDNYWREINGTAGVPFRILLNGSVEAESDYNWNMGFVGQQLANASLMIREAGHSGNPALLEKGEKMVDFWVAHSLSPIGIPRTWYDPIPQTWRPEPTHLRVVGDGMSGLLWAWNFRKKQGVDKRAWLGMAAQVADWLLTIQNSDGSFFQQYDYQTGTVLNTTKNNTSNVIPFLVDLYMITDEEKYRDAAQHAGQFIYREVHETFHYAGGAVDNPNVPDKEGVSMALRAFLALYDISGGGQQWLDAALQAAYYYQTWVYAWDVPIPTNDDRSVFPASRSVTGTSLIATANNAADTYAAIDAFNYYRLYRYTGDSQLLAHARLLFKNTKQFMNWNTADPIPKIAPGLLGEAFTVVIPRGRGVNYFLPWQIYNFLEPMVLLQDVFGELDIDALQALPNGQLDEAHAAYSTYRGFEKGTLHQLTLPDYPRPAMVRDQPYP